MAACDYHFQREDRGDFWRRIATRIAAHPEDLQTALQNIERWLALGRVHPAPILNWRRRILAAQASSEGFTELLNFVAAENHDAEPLKSCSPFAGIPLNSLPGEATFPQ